MSAELLSDLSKLSFGIAIFSFLLAVLFWFKFKIPMVIATLSGSAVKKSLKQLREDKGKSSSEQSANEKAKTRKFIRYKSLSPNIEENIETVLLKDTQEVEENTTVLVPDQDEGEGTTLLEEKVVTSELNGERQEKAEGFVVVEDTVLVNTEERI